MQTARYLQQLWSDAFAVEARELIGWAVAKLALSIAWRSKGVLTSDPLRVTRTTALANMQDESGGILIYTRNPSILMHHVKAGDEVLVSGVIGQFEGAEQFPLI